MTWNPKMIKLLLPYFIQYVPEIVKWIKDKKKNFQNLEHRCVLCNTLITNEDIKRRWYYATIYGPVDLSCQYAGLMSQTERYGGTMLDLSQFRDLIGANPNYFDIWVTTREKAIKQYKIRTASL